MGVEPTDGGRNKKLIWALEAQELHGRPMCSECSDRLRAKRGCFKPGYAVQGNMAFRFSSPRLKEGQAVLTECPRGAVLREAPYVYEAISAHSFAEVGAFDPLQKPMYLQEAMAVVGSELARLWEIKRERERAKADAAHGAAVLGASHGHR